MKGIHDFNKWAKTIFTDVLGFQNHALVCTAITGAWAEVDITNS
jgi:queuine/archaeosine tRNA-ribosyltransferase